MRSVRSGAVLLGGGFVVAGLTGRALLLVRPWFVPILVGTGVLLIVAGARGTRLLSARAMYALLLPVAVGATLTPAIVSHASQGSANTANLSARLGDPGNPLLAGKGGSVTLLQILLAEQRAGGVALAGRSVTVEAIVAGRHRLERSVIVCCAADAQTVSLTEAGTALPRSGSWVRVSGTLTAVGNTVVLDARTVMKIATPSEPFL